MGRHHSHLNTAASILSNYDGSEPFASHLKKFFALHKKYGSRDRKQIGHLCYLYFRLGKNTIPADLPKRIVDAFFLCSDQPSDFLAEINPAYNEFSTASIHDKLSKIGDYSIAAIFPWHHLLSDGIDATDFNKSFLIQPDLFLRIRPGNESRVSNKLPANAVIHNNSVRLPNSVKVDELFEIDKEVVIQDLSSQKIGELIKQVPNNSPPLQLWDCCAASGGKSLLANDLLGNIRITATDVRDSILINLRNRFQRAGLNNYTSYLRDLALPANDRRSEKFQFIICDAPCTGSGTWSRTPEQLYFFDPLSIDHYSQLQKKIVQSAIAQLKPNGYFLYITCSVFNKENETITKFILENTSLKLVEAGIIKGYDQKADTMYAALFSA